MLRVLRGKDNIFSLIYIRSGHGILLYVYSDTSKQGMAKNGVLASFIGSFWFNRRLSGVICFPNVDRFYYNGRIQKIHLKGRYFIKVFNKANFILYHFPYLTGILFYIEGLISIFGYFVLQMHETHFRPLCAQAYFCSIRDAYFSMTTLPNGMYSINVG